MSSVYRIGEDREFYRQDQRVLVPRDGIEPPTRGFSNNYSAKYVNKNNNINLLKLGMLLSMLYQRLSWSI